MSERLKTSVAVAVLVGFGWLLAVVMAHGGGWQSQGGGVVYTATGSLSRVDWDTNYFERLVIYNAGPTGSVVYAGVNCTTSQFILAMNKTNAVCIQGQKEYEWEFRSFRRISNVVFYCAAQTVTVFIAGD